MTTDNGCRRIGGIEEDREMYGGSQGFIRPTTMGMYNVACACADIVRIYILHGT